MRFPFTTKKEDSREGGTESKIEGKSKTAWPGDCVYIEQQDALYVRNGNEVYTNVYPQPPHGVRYVRYTRTRSLWHEADEAGEWAERKPLLLRIIFGNNRRSCYTVGSYETGRGFYCNKLDRMRAHFPDCYVERFAVCYELA